jgi:hypothetical protein
METEEPAESGRVSLQEFAKVLGKIAKELKAIRTKGTTKKQAVEHLMRAADYFEPGGEIRTALEKEASQWRDGLPS